MDNTKKITVNASKSYDVVIGRDIICKLGEMLKPVIKADKIALITDDRVDSLYGGIAEKSLQKAGYNVVKYVFPNGEKSKNMTVYADILSYLASGEITRTDAVVALGGGVVGDMAGFAAATYLRGIKYVQVPTTLLAQIDSSVGGKTAIDIREGKNLVGAFCQPELVVCDVNTLSTLSEKIYEDGMGEAVKYAILDDKIFALLQEEYYDIEDLVYLCIDYKRRVVEKDEFEGGLRRVLNLGHTIAHGIERLSRYTVSHGRAVAMGLKIILEVSKKHGYIDIDVYNKASEIITKNIESSDCEYRIEDIVDASLTDKKRRGNVMALIMIYGIGDVREVAVEIDRLGEYLG